MRSTNVTCVIFLTTLITKSVHVLLCLDLALLHTAVFWLFVWHLCVTFMCDLPVCDLSICVTAAPPGELHAC